MWRAGTWPCRCFAALVLTKCGGVETLRVEGQVAWDRRRCLVVAKASMSCSPERRNCKKPSPLHRYVWKMLNSTWKVIMQPSLFHDARPILAVVRKLFDRVFCIVVIPGHSVILEKREELILILEKAVTNTACAALGANVAPTDLCKELSYCLLMSDEAMNCG